MFQMRWDWAPEESSMPKFCKSVHSRSYHPIMRQCYEIITCPQHSGAYYVYKLLCESFPEHTKQLPYFPGEGYTQCLKSAKLVNIYCMNKMIGFKHFFKKWKVLYSLDNIFFKTLAISLVNIYIYIYIY